MQDVSKLLSAGPVVLDGAWGTELYALGLEPGACPDAWNLSEPERVQSVARSYVDAGSRIILTNTFGGNRTVLGRHGLAERAFELNRAGAEISCRAAGDRATVLGSIGPSGKLLALGEISEAELFDVFSEQARALLEGGVGGIALETFSDLQELCVAISAVRKLTPAFVVACMVFDSGAKKDRSAMGVTPEQAAARLGEVGASAIGANCGRGIESYVPICERLRKSSPLPLWIKPNAGLPELIDGQTRYPTTAEQFAAGALALVAAGADLVGGCCGSNPEFVSALSKAFASVGSQAS